MVRGTACIRRKQNWNNVTCWYRLPVCDWTNKVSSLALPQLLQIPHLPAFGKLNLEVHASLSRGYHGYQQWPPTLIMTGQPQMRHAADTNYRHNNYTTISNAPRACVLSTKMLLSLSMKWRKISQCSLKRTNCVTVVQPVRQFIPRRTGTDGPVVVYKNTDGPDVVRNKYQDRFYR